MSARKGKMRRAVSYIAMAILSTGLLVGVGTTSANADALHGACRGSMWGVLTQDICVHAMMGGKRLSNRTQWVGTVEAAQPTGVVSRRLEIWGDGFYHVTRGVNKTWTINRWVRTNTNICAAETDDYNVREIACIHIHVP